MTSSKSYELLYFFICFVLGGVCGYIGAATLGPLGVIPGIIIAFIINYYVIRPLFFRKIDV